MILESSVNMHIAAALTLLGLSPVATATVNLVGDEVSFETQAGNLSFVDFDGLVEPPDTFSGLGIPLETQGASFSAPLNLAATTPAFGAGYDYGIGTVLTAFGEPGNFTDSNNSFQIGFTLDTLPSAVGFFVANGFSNNGLAGTFSITVMTESLPGDEPGSEFANFEVDADASTGIIFVGLLADRGIVSIEIINNTPAADYLAITSATGGSPFTNLGAFQFGDTVVVPVPTSLALLAAPLFGLAARRRRC